MAGRSVSAGQAGSPVAASHAAAAIAINVSVNVSVNVAVNVAVGSIAITGRTG
jgi:hypothetical protein